MSQPHWVDYANLGANIGNLAVNSAQLQSLHEVNSQLTQLGQIEANRERRRQLENNLRQFVFDEETKLEEFKVQLGANPKALWVSANLIKHNLDSIPVTPASFEEFVDKDRMRKFNNEISAVIRECETQLSPDQLNNARLAFQYTSERAALEQYIEMQKAMEFLSATEEEYRGLKTVKKTIQVKIVFGCLGRIIASLLIFGGLAALFGIRAFVDLISDFPALGTLAWGFGAVLLIAFSVWAIISWFKLAGQELHIQSQELNLQSMRTEMQREIPFRYRQDQLIAQFGVGATSEQLMQMRADREAQVLKLLRWP